MPNQATETTDTIVKRAIDIPAMQAHRLARLRAEMRKAEIPLCVLTNPVSMRYASGFSNYQLFQSRIQIAYLFVPLDGPLVMHGALAIGGTLIAEGRPASNINFFNAGPNWADEARRFGVDVRAFLEEIGADSRRVAVEHVNPSATQALMQCGLDATDALPLVEYAKAIKSPDEILALRNAIDVAQLGMRRMRAALVPGVTENYLWSLLHQTNVEHGGEWIDGRALSTGYRTNPWYQEASDKIIDAGELVAFDTDMLGPLGYCADISRTWLCGDRPATALQKELYTRAYDEVHQNMDLFRPGVAFSEISENCLRQPEVYLPQRYTCIAHGVGIGDEYPKIYYPQDWQARRAYDGVIAPGMCLCVESYVGAKGGPEGVKLEEQILITETGYEKLSDYPYEPELLNR